MCDILKLLGKIQTDGKLIILGHTFKGSLKKKKVVFRL